MYERRRVCQMWVFRALSMKAVATEKTSEEREAFSQDLPASLYKRISRIGARKRSAVAELEGWINEGKERPKKFELKRMVKELRKYSRHEHALEIFEWMSQKFSFSSGELAIHLDLIAKVRGVASAERYFADLPDTKKNRDTYSALLNCYMKEKNIEKSEETMEKLKYLGLAKYTLTYNQMMTLYMNTQQFEKVPLVIQEMKKNGISLNAYSYNIWMNCCATFSDIDQVEGVFNEMVCDDNVDPGWTHYSTLANIYLKAKVFDKVESALKELESKMKRKDRAAYDHLISLYGGLRNKEAVYRIWQSFELAFSKMTNKSYICFLSSLVNIGDFEGAEDFLKKWESLESFDDIEVYNVLLGAYIRKGWFQKAKGLFEHVMKNGFQPNANTRKILAVASQPARSESHGNIGKIAFGRTNYSMAAKVRKFDRHSRTYDRR